MIGGIFKRLLGDKQTQDRKKYQPYAEKSNIFFEQFRSLTDDELRGKTAEFKQAVKDNIKPLEDEIASLKLQTNDPNIDNIDKDELFEKIEKIEKEVDEKIEEVLEEILPQAFAVIKETSRRWVENGKLEVTATDFDHQMLKVRKDGMEIVGDKAIWHNEWSVTDTKIVWNMVHYDVQLVGGAVLHKGNIAEMQTGEGKTLVSTLPVYLNALAGKGVHVVTVNDYLSKRDSEWNGPLFQFHGLTVACLDKTRPYSHERREAYKSDITYGTNNEFGFDYLRDNMTSTTEELVQQKHHFAIIDEVDSVLIDDARTPLIISGPTPRGDEHEFDTLKPRVERVVEAQKKYVHQCLTDAKRLLAAINDASASKDAKKDIEEGSIALLRAYRGFPKSKPLIKFLSEPGMKALLQKTENFYLQEHGKNMKKIDVELYFVIDEKQNTVEITERGIDLLSGTEDKNYYLLPDVGEELTALARNYTDKDELKAHKEALMTEYRIKSERIHSLNQLLKAYALFEKEVDYVVMDGKVLIVDEKTGRILDGRRYSDGLHQAIESKENVNIEAATQTYATVTLQNYFRMYHKLSGMTGTAETEAKELWDIYKLDVVVIPTNRPIIRKDLDDLIYRTQREKFAAVIDETVRLVEAGRPVLIGTTTVEISEFLSRSLKMRGIAHNVLNAKYHQREAEIVAEAGKAGAVTIATNMAGRGTDIKLGDGVKDAGGLAILGTERHDSRRVDRQLRGRAGRQGDPGSSQFFVSLEDDLMRKFGADRIARVMDRLGYKEGEVISHSSVSKSIERAQKKVEENNFGVRKQLLEYDDVMNAQRKAIYKKRKNALFGDKLGIDIANTFYDVIEEFVYSLREKPTLEEFNIQLYTQIGIELELPNEEFATISNEMLCSAIYDQLQEKYNAKNTAIIERVFPQIKDIFQTPNNQYRNFVFPLTDGIKTMELVINIEDAYRTEGKSMIKAFEKSIVLSLIDDEWKEHLREMDDLRSSVRGAVYEQKDPLLVYKLESFELFKSMMSRFNGDVVSSLINMDLPKMVERVAVTNKSEELQNNYQNAHEVSQMNPDQEEDKPIEKPKQKPIVAEQKINRNEPCPCGSGKKYKNCHGAE
ncbi:MAG TPA: preprotein translocase subunit SecA [Crocinitomicaceae bacterium]|nr:preprotein translocase subunit SecA [Crocinitomicaceae bacterium]